MFRHNSLKLQKHLQRPKTDPLDAIRTRLRAPPLKTSLGEAPITNAERQWVHLALRQRRALIVWRYVATALTLLLVGFLLFWILVLAILTEDYPAIPATPTGALFRGAVFLFCVAMCFNVIRHQHRAFWTLRKGLSARVPDELFSTTVYGQLELRNNYDEQEISASVTILQQGLPLPFGTHAIQIPAHWAKHLPNGPCELRLAEVMASGTTTTVESLMRGGFNEFSGRVVRYKIFYATYSDARYVLLAAGPLSVEAEKKAGLRLPRLRSGAALQIYSFFPFVYAFIAFGLWLWPDKSDGLLHVMPAVYAGCAMAALPLILTGLRRRAIDRRAAEFYGTQQGRSCKTDD